MSTPADSGRGGTRRFGRADPFLESLKDRLAQADESIARRYWERANVDELVAERTAFFDGLLRELWDHALDERAQSQLALFAVGGYGRGEQFPHSDIDLLIVGKQPANQREAISTFLQLLYDLDLEVGHSVRTIRDCKREAQKDITVATAIFERRFLFGSDGLRRRLDRVLASSRLWPADDFFRAKRDEQEQRHRQYDNVEHGLEPNVKSSPGGLRDLQTALWVCQRKFGTTDPEALQALGMLTQLEREWLTEGRR